ncbi:MAG: hypothetical protein FJZ38_09470 [Candidatus Rokubacteria bacterium]|nr:hypothetical protein [Candidatus Rokubacteria bacterium]
MPTYLAGLALVASVVWGEARGPLFWTPLVAWVLLWPHLAYLITARSPWAATLVERRLVLVDAFFIGIFIAVMGFRVLPAVALGLPPLLSAGRVGGLASSALSLLALGLGAGAAVLVGGLQVHADVSPFTAVVSITLIVAFTVYIGVVTKAQGDALRHRSKALTDALPSRPRRARRCAPSSARTPTSSRSSKRSSGAPSRSAPARRARCSASTASSCISSRITTTRAPRRRR